MRFDWRLLGQQHIKLKVMRNNNHYLRLYDEKLDLLFEVSTDSPNYKSDKVTKLLRKSKLFLNVGEFSCYRVEPELR